MIKLKIKYGNSQTDLRFPCTEKEMNVALERIHAEDVTPLELYVSEVIFPDELGCLQDRFVNLDEVNFLGKRMDSFFGDEEYQFYEAMKFEGFDTLPDLINLSFNLGRYPLIQDIGDMGKIGREYLLTVKGCLPADDADDPKYAEFGRELIQSGKGVFTEHGLLFVDEDTPFVRDYIKGFFDNVNHGKLLKQMLTLGIRDKKLLSIISVMLKAEVAGIGFPEKGTPQGGIISPLLSNIVLNELDWWVASQWENIPTRYPYKCRTLRNGTPDKSNVYAELRNTT